MKIRAFLASAMSILIFGLTATSAGAAEAVSFMLDWFPNPDHVPIYVAKERGFFEEEGLDVAIQVPADPNDPLKLTAAGRVDFAVNYQPSVVIARSEDLPIVSIGILVEHPLSTIMFLKDSGIRSPADFKGKKIGVSVSPLYDAMFDAVAEGAGLKKGDYQLIDVGFNLTPALLSRRVDAVIGAFRNYEKVQIELEGEEVGIFPLEEYGVPDFYELVIIAGEKKISSNPDTARKFARALKRGIEFTLKNPGEALDIFFAANPDLRDELNRKSFDATLPFFARSQEQSERLWGELQDFMFARNLITKKTNVEGMFTNRFAR
ncbi:MAG: ABC transporter substrate-binding protein [bacterium]